MILNTKEYNKKKNKDIKINNKEQFMLETFHIQ